MSLRLQMIGAECNACGKEIECPSEDELTKLGWTIRYMTSPYMEDADVLCPGCTTTEPPVQDEAEESK